MLKALNVEKNPVFNSRLSEKYNKIYSMSKRDRYKEFIAISLTQLDLKRIIGGCRIVYPGKLFCILLSIVIRTEIRYAQCIDQKQTKRIRRMRTIKLSETNKCIEYTLSMAAKISKQYIEA